MLQKWKNIAIQMTKISMFLGIVHSNAKSFKRLLTIAFSKLHFFSGIQSTISPKNYCCFLMRWKMRIWHQKDSLLNANSFCQRISDMFVSFSWIASQLSIFVNKQRQHKSSVLWRGNFTNSVKNIWVTLYLFYSNLYVGNGYIFYTVLKASSSFPNKNCFLCSNL